MNILDLLAERRSQRQYLSSKKLAEEYFVKQKSAIQAIRDTDGFKEIKSYRERELENCINRLETTKKGELPEVQSALKQSRQFLDFLSNLAQEID